MKQTSIGYALNSAPRIYQKVVTQPIQRFPSSVASRRSFSRPLRIAIPAMFPFLAAGAPSFASIPHSMCPEPKLAAQPPVAGVMPGFGHKAHILLGAAPDYPPYTGWAGTVPDR